MALYRFLGLMDDRKLGPLSRVLVLGRDYGPLTDGFNLAFRV